MRVISARIAAALAGDWPAAAPWPPGCGRNAQGRASSRSALPPYSLGVGGVLADAAQVVLHRSRIPLDNEKTNDANRINQGDKLVQHTIIVSKNLIQFHPAPSPGKAEKPGLLSHGADLRLDELEYRLHLWDETKRHVELLAVTRNISIGYAALYAAAKEYPDKHLTLSRGGKAIYSWGKAKDK
jgi:hypothetical protein